MFKSIEECLQNCKGIESGKDCYVHSMKTGECQNYSYLRYESQYSKLRDNYKKV